MKNKFMCLMALFFVLFSALSFAGTVQEFSADVVASGAAGAPVEKVFVSGGKMRLETNVEGEVYINIVRFDKGKAYILSPSGKNYAEIDVPKNGSFDESLANAMMAGMGTVQIKREKKGAETVGAYKTTKYEVTTTVDAMGFKNTNKSFEWIAPEYEPLPVRTFSVDDNVTTDLRNVKKGAQRADLFEVPAGYKKVASLVDFVGSMEKPPQMAQDTELFDAEAFLASLQQPQQQAPQLKGEKAGWPPAAAFQSYFKLPVFKQPAGTTVSYDGQPYENMWRNVTIYLTGGNANTIVQDLVKQVETATKKKMDRYVDGDQVNYGVVVDSQRDYFNIFIHQDEGEVEFRLSQSVQ